MIEVVSTIFIITIGAVGVFGLVQQTFVFTTVTPSKLTAAYLAQEGIEIARNIRDTNWLKGLAWDTGLTICQPADNKFCEADYNDSVLTPLDNPSPGTILRIRNGFYNYDGGGADSAFRRKITITPEAGNTLKVIAEVTWQERARIYKINVQENLYNWR